MKRFIFGLIIGAGLMISVNANAEVANLVGQVIEGQFPVKVDGELVETPGIVVNGTSYLPVRVMGELFGYDVSFNVDFGVELRKKVIPTQEVNQQTKIKEPSKETIEQRIITLEDQINTLKEMIEKWNLPPQQVEELQQQLEELEERKAKLLQQLQELEQAP